MKRLAPSPLLLSLIAILVGLSFPHSTLAQNATLQVTVTAPLEFDLLANGAHPIVSCTQELYPNTTYTQELSFVSSGTYVANVSVLENLSYCCMVTSILDGLDTNYRATLFATSGQVTKGTLALTAFDSDVTLQFVTSNAGSYVPFSIPSGNPQATAFCIDADYNYAYEVLLNPGDTSAVIRLYGGMNYYCQVIQVDGYGSGMLLFDVDQNSHLTGQSIILPFDASAKIHLVDQEGKAIVSSIPTQLYCGSNEVPFNFPPVEIKSGENSGIINLVGGHSYTCSISGILGYAAIYNASFFLAAEEANKDVNLPLAPLNEHLIVSLIQSDNSPYIVGAQEYVYANCRGPYFLSFSQQILAGENSTDIKVLNGEYSCSASMVGHAVRNATVSVAQNATATVSLSIIERNANIFLHLQNQNGQAVTDLTNIKMSIWPDDPDVVDWSWGSLINGEATAQIAPNIPYFALVYDGTSGSGSAVQSPSQKHYLFPGKAKNIQATPGETKDLPITIYETDAAITVTVLNAEGTGMAGIYVQAVETLESAGTDYRLISTATTDSSGLATIPVVSGKTFEVSLLTTDTRAGIVPPPSRQLLSPQETKAVVLRYESVDFRLKITAQAQSLDHGLYYCYAYDNNGHMVVSDAGTPLGQMLSLSLLSSSSWHIGCSGANESYYFSTDEFIYTPPSGQSTDSITINATVNSILTSSVNSYSGSPAFHIDGESFSSSYSILPSSANSVSPKEGLTVNLSAGALDTVQTQAIVTIANATGLAANESAEPLRSSGLAISAQDTSQTSLHIATGKTIEIVLLVNKDELNGIEPSSVQGARYDSSLGTYSIVNTAIERNEADGSVRYTLTALQMGTYVLLKPRIASSPTPSPTPQISPTPTTPPSQTPLAAPGTPRKISLKAKHGKVQISWKAPLSGGNVESYKLIILRGKRTIINTTLPSTTLSYLWKKKVIAGPYTLRLSAANKTGSSKMAKKTFKLKGSTSKLRLG